ncbi:putative succinyl-diaminopimelate desuccinylase [Staphylococcus piscifermentans]|uniref:Peptidase M20 n=1 Tax=Staphylococcus piscifermentans TaxID=70258 RepID=A0A239TEC2_9STAP|nr:M20/M25/M40 family metallo-hydrolase [Staphylococcus piscifermentans]RTX86690.1 M20 family peptidase [Staphylococcus piscifermentans]GEP83671.1 peptidase M20 [Staphylococcus piscifermentans]SNU96055.1 putative succinyl-diaminopimelate desuccinylase [Staphylococcus piscifermentans]
MTKTLDLLKSLIEFDSSTKDAANKTLQFCKAWLEQEGLEPVRLTNDGFDSLICNVGAGEKRLILNGHVDVVSGNPDQFEPKVEGNKIYGRGSADMKAGVSAMMSALSELQHKDLGNTSVQLQLVTDEEIGGKHGANFLTEQGYLGDFVICGEPTQLGIGYQAKGILQIDIHLKGKSAHGSRPWEGDNAIEKALETYQKILELPFAKESTALFDGPSINLAKIRGGTVYNKVPDEAVISYDIRFLPGQNEEEILKQIQTITDGEISVHLSGASVINETDNPLIQKLVKEISEETQQPAETIKLFGQHGFADTRYFARFGTPAVEFGPSGAAWHGDNEYAEINSIETYKNILVKFAESYSK